MNCVSQAEYLHPPYASMDTIEKMCVEAAIPVIVIVRSGFRDAATLKVCRGVGSGGGASASGNSCHSGALVRLV